MLYIKEALKSQIKAEGEKSYPNECCGVLLGTLDGEGEKNVTQIMPIENARLENERYNRFLITPEDMMRAEKKARTLGLDVLGFYHSHPDHPAEPSDFDLEHALPFYSYIIVAVDSGRAAAFNSWLLEDDRRGFIAEKTGG